MAPFLFNFTEGDPRGATERLEVDMWGVGREQHGDELVPGDLVLIYVAAPEARFIGRAEVRTAVRDWTPPELATYPADERSGVLLSHVERWEPGVPMEAAVRRIDPAGSNPLVQANAAAGFSTRVVRITSGEYEAVVALSRDARP